MARGENPSVILTIETTLTYDKDVDFGHASAGKDLVLTMVGGTGADKDKAQLGADGDKILGKFLSLDKDKVASYMPTGTPLLLRKTAPAIATGSGLLAAGSGKVKASSGATSTGQVVKIIETGDNGRILALMP